MCAAVSLAAAAAVHHAPSLSRLDAVNVSPAAAACIRVAAAAAVGFSVKIVWKSCRADVGGRQLGPAVIWFTTVVACFCYVLFALLQVDAGAGGGGAVLLPARVLLLQFLLSVLMCWLQPSRDSLCAALSSALYLAGLVSGCVVVYACVALLMAATFKLYVMCSSGASASPADKASSFGCGCHAWTLAVICWYGTNHAPQFSSLKVSSGFAFVSSFNWHICGASLFFETFAPVLVWALCGSPPNPLLLTIAAVCACACCGLILLQVHRNIVSRAPRCAGGGRYRAGVRRVGAGGRRYHGGCRAQCR